MSSGHAVAEGLAERRSELLRLARAMSLETAIVRASLAAVALHVLDDNYLQPQPGTSASDHLTSGLVPVAILLGVAVVYPRLRAGARAAVAMTFGALSLSFGFPAVYHLLHDGISGDDYTGLLATAAGATLLLSGPVILWRSRKRGGSRRRRYLRRLLVTLLGALAAFLVIAYVVFPVAFSYGYTHLGRTGPLPDIGFPSERVTVTTDDSIELAATYVPSKNRAAVVVYPGRSALAEAKMLIRNGYGVLLLDPRGQGESQGDLVRWAGDRDLIAAAEYLQGRPDVDPGRVGGFGSSVGGEILLGAAAESTAFKAVVSEGAGLPAGEGGDVLKGTEKLLLLPALVGIKFATSVFSNHGPPPPIVDQIGRIAPRSVFLIYTVPGMGGEDTRQPKYFAAAGKPKAIWKVPGAEHTGGIDAHPAEYERRVVRFFNQSLLGKGGTG